MRDRTYTATGTYEWTTKFSSFYYGGTVDWSKGVNKVALILKDTKNGKPQGNPLYVPTKLQGPTIATTRKRKTMTKPVILSPMRHHRQRTEGVATCPATIQLLAPAAPTACSWRSSTWCGWLEGPKRPTGRADPSRRGPNAATSPARLLERAQSTYETTAATTTTTPMM